MAVVLAILLPLKTFSVSVLKIHPWGTRGFRHRFSRCHQCRIRVSIDTSFVFVLKLIGAIVGGHVRCSARVALRWVKNMSAKGSILPLVLMNVGCVVQGGRSSEGFRADPFLASVYAYETILGMRSAGVQACAKHFINQ
jgi:hypothetical protein